MAKSWEQKYHNGKSPIVKTLEKKFADIEEGEKMLIATPQLIDEYIHQIPEGSAADPSVIRKDLALDHLADKTCPVTTGIFLRIVAEKAYQEYEQGKPVEEITPFWRVVNQNTPIVKKLSFGYEFIAQQREREGLPV